LVVHALLEAGDEALDARIVQRVGTWPEAACTTYRVSMLELKEFEENLHQHVHLENNILFPKALNF